jgi:FKBP-type peptidyl-prolyl cis-trans isomerase SlyD
MRVRVRYRAFDEDGEPVEDLTNELVYVHGFGALLPRLEAALEGQRIGALRSVVLSPHEAFGPRRKQAVVEFSPEDFPQDVRAGDRFDADSEDGRLVVLRVLEVRPDAVVVDMNHPLAGQRVRFELEVMDVTLASESELRAAEERVSAPGLADGPLIPAERLLRGPSQRYEMGPSAPKADDET